MLFSSVFLYFMTGQYLDVFRISFCFVILYIRFKNSYVSINLTDPEFLC